MAYDKNFASQKIVVEGREIDVSIMGPDSDVSIGPDISSEMDRVSAQMAYWGSVMAAAASDAKKADSWYRRWRAEYSKVILNKEPKLAEWKVKNELESSPKFIKYKDAIALTERNLKTCEAMYQAFGKKANQLQSKGAKMRTEMNAQGMTTPSEETGWDLSGDGSEHDDDTPDEDAEHQPDEELHISNKPTPEQAQARMQEINKKSNRRSTRPSSKTNRANAKRQQRR